MSTDDTDDTQGIDQKEQESGEDYEKPCVLLDVEITELEKLITPR